MVPPNCAFHLGHSTLGRLEEAGADPALDRPGAIVPGIAESRSPQLQRDDEAGEHIATLRAQAAFAGDRQPDRDDAARARVLDGLRSAGLPV